MRRVKKGTFDFDTLMVIGEIILVFALIFYSLTVGLGILTGILGSSYGVLQDSTLSYISMGCIAPGDFEANQLTLIKQFTFVIEDGTLDVEVPAFFYLGSTPRSGYRRQDDLKPHGFVQCGDRMVVKLCGSNTGPEQCTSGSGTLEFFSSVHKNVDIKKIGNELKIKFLRS